MYFWQTGQKYKYMPVKYVGYLYINNLCQSGIGKT